MSHQGDDRVENDSPTGPIPVVGTHGQSGQSANTSIVGDEPHPKERRLRFEVVLLAAVVGLLSAVLGSWLTGQYTSSAAQVNAEAQQRVSENNFLFNQRVVAYQEWWENESKLKEIDESLGKKLLAHALNQASDPKKPEPLIDFDLNPYGTGVYPLTASTSKLELVGSVRVIELAKDIDASRRRISGAIVRYLFPEFGNQGTPNVSAGRVDDILDAEQQLIFTKENELRQVMREELAANK